MEKESCPSFNEFQKLMCDFNLREHQALVSKNIKRIRKQLNETYKSYYKERGERNPFSSQSIAELLDISHEYYKQIEGNCENKPISTNLFFRVYVLFSIMGIDVREFFKR